MKNKEKSRYFLSTIGKALSVFDLFRENEALGITEIAHKLSMGKSNVFRIVITLEHWGYLEKTQEQKYRLGTTLAYFGNLVLERQQIITIARPFLRKLKDANNETAHLAILTPDNEVIFLLKEVSGHSIQMASTIGLKMPLYVTANGKVLLAFSEQAFVDEYMNNTALVRKTKNTIVSKKKLLKNLEEIREAGFAIDNEESEIGLVCYAAPVRNMSGKVIASISMSGPAFRMADKKEVRVKAVKTIAHEISRSLGYSLNDN